MDDWLTFCSIELSNEYLYSLEIFLHFSDELNSPTSNVENRSQANNDITNAENSSESVPRYSMRRIEAEIESGNLKYRKIEYFEKKGVKRAVVSDVWNQFFQVYDVENNNDVSNWYVCSLCSKPIENLYGNGTTLKFRRHRTKCLGKSEGSRKIDEYFFTPKRVKLTEDHIDIFNEAAVRFVCEDLRPYSSVEGKGFFELIFAAVKLGQTYPNISREEIMQVVPSRTKVKRSVESKLNTVSEMIAKKLQDSIATCGGFGATTDLWTDSFRQKSYMAITIHINLLTEHQIVNERLLIMMNEITDESKTKEVVEREIFDCFAQYGLTRDELKTNMRLITDRGAQMKAMSSFHRSNCYAHILNNVVQAICKHPVVNDMIKDAQSLIVYMKMCGLNFRNKIVLKSYVHTRWNTVYVMLQSIIDSYRSIFHVLEKRQNSGKREHRQCLDRIECLRKSTLLKVAHFLKPFKEWSDRIEAEKEVTLHQVMC